MLKTSLFGAVSLLTLMIMPAAEAHHAVQSQFDVTKNIQFDGILTKVEWTNPHAWFHFDVKMPDGTTEEWATETIGPNGLRRLGLSDRRLFVIGDPYHVDINPDRSGKHYGFTNSFTFKDGKFIKVGFPEDPNGQPPADLNVEAPK